MKVFRISLAILCIIALVVGQWAFAVPGKNDKEGPVKGWEKELKDYQVTDGSKIVMGNKPIKFDVPPVIKEGRTLIPVRAITEGMGAKVEWDPATSVVTITSQDGKIIVKMYLAAADGGKITVTEDGQTTVVTTDVRPGIINNRTFVPLRFIAELFGRHVEYDDDGQINIDDGPSISPKSVPYASLEAITSDLPITLTLNGYTFTSIQGVDPIHYTFVAPNTVLIKEAYLESLKNEQVKLNFLFSKGSEVEKRVLSLKFAYNVEVAMPKLTPSFLKFDRLADIVNDLPITLTLNGYTFEGIEGLSGDQFAYNGTTGVLLKAAYVKALTNEKTTLNFLFKKGDVVVKKGFEIELVFNKVVVEEMPAIVPTKISFNTLADITADMSVILDLKGYFFDGILGLASPQFTYDGMVTVKLDDGYIKSLAANKTLLNFTFHKGTDPAITKTIPFEIELKYIPVPTP